MGASAMLLDSSNPALNSEKSYCNKPKSPLKPSNHSANLPISHFENPEPPAATLNRNQNSPLIPNADETVHFPPLPSLSSHHQHIHQNRPLSSEPNPWTKPITINPRPPRKFLLRFIPPVARGSNVVGVCSADSVIGELQILDNTVVGFFLGKRPSFSYVRANLLKQWNLCGSVEVLQLLQGGIAFRFSDITDRDMVIDEGMYYVGGQPIFLRPWERNLHTGGVMGLKKVPLWVSLPGLPLHLWGEDSLSAVCSVLGKPMFTDQITASKSRWAFARACVEFSGDKPLLDTVMIEDDDGNIFHQPVKYSWRPPQCLTCGIFGHDLNACKPSSSTAEEENLDANHSKSFKDPATDRLSKKNQISSLLQAMPARNLLGRKPNRVRTMESHGAAPNPQVQDPTRVQTQLVNSEGCQSAERVSATPSNPPAMPPDFLPADRDHFPSRLLNSNLPDSLIPVSISNQFAILDPSVSQSESSTESSTCPLDNSHLPSLDPLSIPAPILTLPPHVGSNLNPSPNPTIWIPYSNFQSPTQVSGLNTEDHPMPKPSQTSTEPSPSSIGHTPHPSRGSSFSRTMQLFNRPSPLSRSPFSPSSRKHFRSCTPGDLEALMAPAVDTKKPEHPEDEDEDEDEEVGKEVDGGAEDTARRKRCKERKKSTELDHSMAVRAVETWEDLEASLRDPRNFFHHDDKDPI